MKMSSKLVECTLSQFKAEAVPDAHPAVAQFNELFGNHTFFLDDSGLNIVEPAGPTESGAKTGVVVKLATWSDSTYTRLTPHPPEETEVVILLDAA
jgi:hypothetical protein